MNFPSSSNPLSDWITLADDNSESVDMTSSTDESSRRDIELMKPIEIEYRAKIHYSNWYASGDIGNENNINQSSSGSFERDKSDRIKWEIGHLYLKKQYLNVIELIFSTINLKNTDRLSNQDDEYLLQNYFSNDTVFQFSKKFITAKLPVILKRELLDTFIRCLFKIVNCYCVNVKPENTQELKRTVVQKTITYYSVIEKDILNNNQQMSKANRIPRSHKANFLLDIWDLKAQTQLIMAKHFLSKSEATHVVMSSVLLLQKCLHCKDSLLFMLEEDGKKPKQHSENLEGTNLDFRLTLVDTCYQTSTRSSSIWKHLEECYSYLEMPLCARRSSYFSRSLTRINSLFNSIATKHSYSKEKIHTFSEEELSGCTIDECYLPNITNAFEIPFPTVEDAIAFDKKFVEIYLFNTKTIHSILSEQRGLKSTEDIDDSLIKRGNDEDDEDAPRTFDASQL
ncbi:hypothetical protein FDP41_000409 [Naegleria fowleri]|uniref:Uncharacterized protein n=1 Tax=Naegleria fowleri TaxID=5763 RepID=A0A6A5CG01_NAEFO|nr:uncharacterized protein FDP41_000409 [Naegleria fowleri]KAF0984510.1 hypothetical protein FDP41_000409 [Naegleria fowleri]